jgi:hypothetical protein
LDRAETSSHRALLLWALAIGFAAGAALCYFAYVANGMVAGALIGVKDREGDVALAQQHATYYVFAAALFQAAVAVILFVLMRTMDAARSASISVRSLAAVFMSLPFTCFVTAGIYVVMMLLKPLLR